LRISFELLYWYYIIDMKQISDAAVTVTEKASDYAFIILRDDHSEPSRNVEFHEEGTPEKQGLSKICFCATFVKKFLSLNNAIYIFKEYIILRVL
jgi:hypothetical protein